MGYESEEGNGRQVTSAIALRSQVHDWVQGQVHAFEYKAEKNQADSVACWTGEQGRKVQEKEEGIKKIYNFPRKKHLTYYSTADRKNVSKTGL